MVYLDNAATSYPKPETVYREMDWCMREYCANPGRSGHDMAIKSARLVLQAREELCSFFNIDNPMQLCFTKNATEALNLAIKGYLSSGDHVITTSMEHNSVIRPLKTLEKELAIDIDIVQGDAFGKIDPIEFKKRIKPSTRLFISTLSSNVNGMIMPVKEIGQIAAEYGIAFLVDASQGAGTLGVDVKKMNIDMLAFPGHKCLLGPQGTGGLYVHSDIKLKPLMQGGTGSQSENLYQPDMTPDLYESGTLNTPGIAGLYQGLLFIGGSGINKLRKQKHLLVSRLQEGIREIKGIRLYSSDEASSNSGIAAMNFEGTDSAEIANQLNSDYGIAVRPGIHCSPLAHKTLGTTNCGIVRFSPGCFNTFDDIDYTLDSLRKISSKIGKKV